MKDSDLNKTLFVMLHISNA